MWGVFSFASCSVRAACRYSLEHIPVKSTYLAPMGVGNHRMSDEPVTAVTLCVKFPGTYTAKISIVTVVSNHKVL